MCINMNLNVLVVTDCTNFTSNVNKLMSSVNEGINSYTFESTVDEACEALKNDHYDLLIINNKSINTIDINHIIEIDAKTTGILLMVDENEYVEAFTNTYKNGVLVISRPVTVQKFVQGAKILVASIDKKRRVIDDEKKLREIRFVDVAKLLLIANEKISEDEAHKDVEKFAMNLRVTKEKAAGFIIDRYIRG